MFTVIKEDFISASAVEFVEPYLLSPKQSGYSRHKWSSGRYLKTCPVIKIKVRNH